MYSIAMFRYGVLLICVRMFSWCNKYESMYLNVLICVVIGHLSDSLAVQLEIS